MQFAIEQMARLEALVAKHDEQIAQNSAQIAQNSAQIAQNSAQIATVSDLIGRVAQADLQLVKRIDSLRDAQADTDYKLNALIETVDKLVRRNGGASKS